MKEEGDYSVRGVVFAVVPRLIGTRISVRIVHVDPILVITLALHLRMVLLFAGRLDRLELVRVLRVRDIRRVVGHGVVLRLTLCSRHVRGTGRWDTAWSD